MTLRVWIEKTGPKKIAKALKVEAGTVGLWKSGVLPRPGTMVEIFAMSKGKVTYRDMVLGAARFQRSRK